MNAKNTIRVYCSMCSDSFNNFFSDKWRGDDHDDKKGKGDRGTVQWAVLEVLVDWGPDDDEKGKVKKERMAKEKEKERKCGFIGQVIVVLATGKMIPTLANIKDHIYTNVAVYVIIQELYD